MSHHVEVSGKSVIAALSGTLDGETARGLATALREKAFPGATVVLEMSGVSSVDVEGITQLVTLKRRAEREQGKLVLAAPSYEVMDALRSNGLDRDFETAPTRDAALGGSAQAPGHGGGSSFSPPPSFAPEPAYSSSPPPPPPPAYIPTDPEPFVSPPPPPPAWTPEEPARRREEPAEESNEWAKPSGAAPRADRPPPPVMAAPVPHATPKKKKKSALPLILVLLLVLGGGGTAAWWFLLRNKPEMITLAAGWEIEEGKDAEFEIKFKNAAGLVLKDGVMPNELYLDETVKDYADGQKSQTIKGLAKDTGEFTLTYAAKPADGEAGKTPGTVKIRITAAPVTDSSGGKLRELMVGMPVKAGVQELARGCVKATAEKLADTGLAVKVDPLRKVASLEGKPAKEGDFPFTLKAENSDGKAETFTYTLTIKPEPKPVVVETPPVTPPVVDTPPVTPPVETPPVTPPVDKPPVTPPVVGKPPPPPPPPVETLDPDMIIMLNERVARSRFPETEKIQMRAAVNEVRWARKLATVPFAHGEKVISAAGKAELLAALAAEPELRNADALKDMDFVVVGYASKSGTLAQNIAISKSRAASVTVVLKSSEYAIEPKFTGDYGATDVLGGSEDANRVVEVYAVKVSESTRNALRKLIEDMKRISGAR